MATPFVVLVVNVAVAVPDAPVVTVAGDMRPKMGSTESVTVRPLSGVLFSSNTCTVNSAEPTPSATSQSVSPVRLIVAPAAGMIRPRRITRGIDFDRFMTRSECPDPESYI